MVSFDESKMTVLTKRGLVNATVVLRSLSNATSWDKMTQLEYATRETYRRKLRSFDVKTMCP